MPKVITDLLGRQWDHYDDSNYTELTGTLATGDAHPHVVVAGEKRFLAALKPRMPMASQAIPYSASGLQLYSESDFAAIIADRNANGSWPMNFCDFACKDQNGHSSCWGSAPTHGAQMKARIQGLPGEEWSTCSVTGPITGYSDVGGYGENALNYLQEHGAVPARLWPNNSYSRSYFTTTNTERIRFKVLVRVEITTWQEMFSAIAQGHPTHNDLGWWSHVICGVAFVDPSTLIIRNSWSDDWGNKLTFPNGAVTGGFSTLAKNKAIDLGSGNTYAIVEVTSYAAAA